jgi:aspartyl protease family protein
VQSNSQNLIPGGIVLQADPSGHYKGTVLINNKPFPFVIDTGATTVAIPRKMAYDARLPFGDSVKISTANGDVDAHQTRVASLQIGAAKFTNFVATIMPNLDEVLIGMNILKYFRITQSMNTLTLASLSPEELAVVGGAVALPPTSHEKPNSAMIPRTTWSKTVTCDENNKCKTSYR